MTITPEMRRLAEEIEALALANPETPAERFANRSSLRHRARRLSIAILSSPEAKGEKVGGELDECGLETAIAEELFLLPHNMAWEEKSDRLAKAVRNYLSDTITPRPSKQPVAIEGERETFSEWKTRMLPNAGAVIHEIAFAAWQARGALAKPPVPAVDVLDMICNPRRWTQAMHDAWHKNVPDTQAAFEALRDAAEKVTAHAE